MAHFFDKATCSRTVAYCTNVTDCICYSANVVCSIGPVEDSMLCRVDSQLPPGIGSSVGFCLTYDYWLPFLFFLRANPYVRCFLNLRWSYASRDIFWSQDGGPHLPDITDSCLAESVSCAVVWCLPCCYARSLLDAVFVSVVQVNI